jgi:hypothetical protein
MTEDDYGSFERAFRRLSAAFRVKPVEAESLSRTYFRALLPYTLQAVLDAGKALLGTSKHFPRVAEWLDVLGPIALAPTDHRHMTVAEMDEKADAEKKRYEGPPCLCSACVRAGVVHQFLRFVPTVTHDGETELYAFTSRRNVLEIVGHWAHGEELLRYYAAKTAFFSLLGKKPLVSARVFAGDREPGQEG